MIDDKNIDLLQLSMMAFDLGFSTAAENRNKYISITSLAKKYEEVIEYKCDQMIQNMLAPIVSEPSFLDADMCGETYSDSGLFPYEILAHVMLAIGDDKFTINTLLGNIRFNHVSLKRFLKYLKEHDLDKLFPMTMQLDSVDGHCSLTQDEIRTIHSYRFIDEMSDALIKQTGKMVYIRYTNLVMTIVRYSADYRFVCNVHTMHMLVDDIRNKCGRFKLLIDDLGNKKILTLLILAIGVDQFFQMYQDGNVAVERYCEGAFDMIAEGCIRSMYDHCQKQTQDIVSKYTELDIPKKEDKLPIPWKEIDANTLVRLSNIVCKVLNNVRSSGIMLKHDDKGNLIVDYVELVRIVRGPFCAQDISDSETFAIFWALRNSKKNFSAIVMPINYLHDREFLSSIIHTFHIEKNPVNKVGEIVTTQIADWLLRDRPAFYRASALSDDGEIFSFWIVTDSGSSVEAEIDKLIAIHHAHDSRKKEG